MSKNISIPLEQDSNYETCVLHFTNVCAVIFALHANGMGTIFCALLYPGLFDGSGAALLNTALNVICFGSEVSLLACLLVSLELISLLFVFPDVFKHFSYSFECIR